MSATFRWTWPMSTAGSSGSVTLELYEGVLLPTLALAAFELEHERAQKGVQLLFLFLRQRRADQGFALGLGTRRLEPLFATRLRQLDEHTPAVVRVRESLDEAGLLQPVEPIRHRSA